MESDFLKYYEDYLRLVSGQEAIRVIVSYPDLFIDLLRENEMLKQKQRDYNQIVAKYGMELTRAIQAEDKLHTLRAYLDELGIIVPHFKW